MFDSSRPSSNRAKSTSNNSSAAISRRKFIKLAGYAGAGLGTVGLTQGVPPVKGFAIPDLSQNRSPKIASTIKVGILHAITGTLAISEKSLVDAELLAIAEINRTGGVLGRRVEPIIEDGATDWSIFSEKAKKLIQRDRVVSVFGGWTSASRKAMLPVLENNNHLLWYPATYEGQECSKNIIYTGSVPNQQIEPATNWLLSRYPNQPIFLVGSDYVYPRVANTIIRSQLEARRIPFPGEIYFPLGVVEVEEGIRQIKARMPKGGVIINSLVGDSNIAFFKQLRDAGLTAQKYPVLSFSLTEEDLRAIGANYLEGHYAAASYFQTVNTAANARFVQAFHTTYGRDRLITDEVQSAYVAVHLWKKAVEKAGTATNLAKVRAAAIGQSIAAPEGTVTLTKNHHLAKFARIGQVRSDGSLQIVYESKQPIAPQPWNQQIRATKGYACDWTTPARGGKYRV